MIRKRGMILEEVDELVNDLLEYNRAYDDNIKKGDIEKSIIDGQISIDEITERFRKKLKDALKDYIEFIDSAEN